MYLPSINPEHLSSEQRALYDDMQSVLSSNFSSLGTKRKDGGLVGPLGVWIHDPSVFGEAAWRLTKDVTTKASLSENVRQTAILTVGSHFKAEYELYAHKKLAASCLSETKIASLTNNTRPNDLTPSEAVAYDISQALLHGGPLQPDLYKKGSDILGNEGVRELIYLVGTYCLVSMTLNGFGVQSPVPSSTLGNGRPSEYKTISPMTGETLRSFPETTDEEVFEALNTAHVRWSQDWRLRTVEQRAQLMHKAAKIMREREEHLAQLITREMGKLIPQARYEVGLSADVLEYYATHAVDFLKPKALPETNGCVLKSEPIGIIFAIEPWNFPYYQLARVAGPQLVAGNAVIVKHAPTVPQCALAFAQLFRDAGFPEGVYTNLFCSISQANSLIDDFRVQGVTLTGSTRAGASVAQRAGQNLKKVVLEMGGSDPFLVLEDAPLEQTIPAACKARIIAMGQACVSSKRFIVIGKERGRLFLEGLKREMEKLKPGDPADASTSIGPLFSERAVEGLLSQIEVAKKYGAKVIHGGKRIDHPGCFLEPTIITDISEENPLFQEETFGPVASVYIVDTEAEAIRIANATPFGLGASVFGKDLKHAQDVADKIDSGMVFVNSYAYTAPEAPFGGIKNSGFGRELSELGIGEFVNKKLIKTATL
ncbi:succinate-semialdehyde dehydrogenase, putative [Paecilomyces variotii No. 5]|uniref:Succinate-semialdehyde dehydrogenase, putative n=1 Tax=Byssochlamys spectabilis (strain No. 5 / NBRC 109023) TaxID=1356009 RepID=V5FPU2_BYSSN|nr:succinate-semialdehyde dehydrogenase, putative [Paecilomyces variotii No. 5]